MQDFLASDGSYRECICQTGDDGMSEALLGHAVFDVGNMFGQPSGEVIYAMGHLIGVEAKFFGQAAPMVKSDFAHTVFAAQLHRKTGLLDVNVRVGQNTGQTIKRRKAGAAF